MLQYLLQSILFQLVFLLVYELLLKKETFFSYNRWYLLLTPVVSLLLPFFSFSELSNVVPSEAVFIIPEVVLGQGTEIGGTSEMLALNTDGLTMNIWVLLYSLGVLGSVFIFFRKYRVLRQLFRNRIVSEESGLSIIEVSNSKIACTFFNTIFIGDQLSQEQREQILSHELVHVSQKHSYDLLFFEIFRILFWFNPLIYIYQNQISALHEFIADAGVVRTVDRRIYYQQLLNTAFNTENISFINQFFNQSLIKKRIVMLQKTQSRSIAKLKFLVLFPVLFCMLTVVSHAYAQETEPTEEETPLVYRVGDVYNPTPEEQARIKNYLTLMKENGAFPEVVITDGSSMSSYKLNKENGELISSEVTKVPGDAEWKDDVPFEIISEVPVFPGCEEVSDPKEMKQCLVEGITKHVNTNFDVKLAKDMGLSGMQKVYVQFQIDKTGKVAAIKARGPVQELEDEAIRVVESLPRMVPGKHKGETVDVLFSLPIKFSLPEKEEESSTHGE